MIYSINYDLKKPGRDYQELYKGIKSCGDLCHHLESTWLVDTSLSAQAIWDRLQPHVDQNDSMLVIGVTRAYQGWLPQEAWAWLNARTSRMAA